jgi:hypothetical protein
VMENDQRRASGFKGGSRSAAKGVGQTPPAFSQLQLGRGECVKRFECRALKAMVLISIWAKQ